MNSGPASRTRSKGSSLGKLPDELLQVILEYASSGGFSLRLVCRRFNAILSSLLLSSIEIFTPIFTGYKGAWDYIQLSGKRFWNSAILFRRNAPLCPIDSHIKHVTITPTCDNDDDYDEPREIGVYGSLPERIIKHLPMLKSVKLIHDVSDTARVMDCSIEEVQAAVNKLITALKHLPAIHTEVELFLFATNLDARSLSLQPTHWYHRNIKWPNNIEDVWSMIDSLEVGAEIEDKLGRLAPESISNRHIFHLRHRYMVPGNFLCIQFPKGFPSNLKKLHLRNPLIVNTTEILHMLRNCKYLKDLSLFAIFNNMESREHGLPPGLETLELLESGGTLLPTLYSGLTRFRYTFVDEPSAGDMSTVRNFIEHTPISHFELNAVSFDDLKEIPQWDYFGRRTSLLENVVFDQFGHCRISRSAAPSLREYIINLSSHPNCRSH